jgi:hypothetical protein
LQLQVKSAADAVQRALKKKDEMDKEVAHAEEVVKERTRDVERATEHSQNLQGKISGIQDACDLVDALAKQQADAEAKLNTANLDLKKAEDNVKHQKASLMNAQDADEEARHRVRSMEKHMKNLEQRIAFKVAKAEKESNTIHRMQITTPTPLKGHFKLGHQNICLHSQGINTVGASIQVYSCLTGAREQNWVFDSVKGQIKNKYGICVSADNSVARAVVRMSECDVGVQLQRWDYRQAVRNPGLIQLRGTELCIESSTQRGKAKLAHCDASAPQQSWLFNAVSAERYPSGFSISTKLLIDGIGFIGAGSAFSDDLLRSIQDLDPDNVVVSELKIADALHQTTSHLGGQGSIEVAITVNCAHEVNANNFANMLRDAVEPGKDLAERVEKKSISHGKMLDLVISKESAIVVSKLAGPQAVDCGMSPWSMYSTCSRDCDGGTRSRTRTVLIRAHDGGRECANLKEEETCNTQSCVSIDCRVTQWGNFDECSKMCGSGTQIRVRTILQAPEYDGITCPQLSEDRQCNTQPCMKGVDHQRPTEMLSRILEDDRRDYEVFELQAQD